MASHFSITRAVRNGFHFCVDNAAYLARAGVGVALADFITTVLLATYRSDASNLELALWRLPAAAVTGWYIFIIARLMMLGERRDQMPRNMQFLLDRFNAMQASVLIYMIFSMAMAVLQDALLYIYSSINEEAGFLNYMAAFMTMVVTLWAIRFGILPIASAVHFPVQEFLIRVHGFEFSVRIMFMVLLCAIPIFFVFSMLASPFIEDPTNMSQGARVILSGISALSYAMLIAVAYSAAVYGLREILGAKTGSRP